MHQPPIPQIDAEDPEIARLIHGEAHRQARQVPADPVGELCIARRA